MSKNNVILACNSVCFDTLRRRLLPVVALFLMAPLCHAQSLLEREAVQEYVRTISAEHQLNQGRVAGYFARTESQPAILEAMSSPAEHVLTWAQYRPIFITQKRIDEGREFLAQNRDIFMQAEAVYGVPSSVLAAIIGVETFYGRITGKHGVFESIATLAFDFPRRSAFFTSELTEFILLAEAEGWSTLEVKGSYAGAMGMPQFISSSYREYAVDFDHDGKRDLFNSRADVIGSVANYLKIHGWRPGAPIARLLEPKKATAKASQLRDLVSKKLAPPDVNVQAVQDLGFSVSGKHPVSIMRMEAKEGDEYWLGHDNFYTITRYNHSELYALAVYQLSRELGSVKP